MFHILKKDVILFMQVVKGPYISALFCNLISKSVCLTESIIQYLDSPLQRKMEPTFHLLITFPNSFGLASLTERN